jgi:hypothetical protein
MAGHGGCFNQRFIPTDYIHAGREFKELIMATESTEEHGKTDFTAETQRTQRKILIEKRSSGAG